MVPPPSARRILLVDCDMFYVQVARLEDPEGVGREPLLIVGGSASGRGVVTSASYECRRFGVRSAMPTAEALRLCPDAVVVGVPRGAVSRYSRAVREAPEAPAPVVPAEFYRDLTGTERLFHHEPLARTATRIREQVLRDTGISVSIGGGTNRLVAKLATRPAKPGGVFVVPPGGEEAFVGGLELRDLPGVGPALLETLRDRGVETIAAARVVGPEWLERWLGPGRAAWLDRRMRGRDDSEVVHGEGRKSISAERTFSRDIDDDADLTRRLLALTVSVSGTLREQGLLARTVTVKLRDGDFTTRQRSHTFPEPVESDRVVFPVARAMLHDLRRRRPRPARLIGVGLSNLVEGPAPRQMALFESTEPRETEADRALNRAVDGLRHRFGRDAVVPGGIVDAPRESSRDGRDPEDS